MQNIDGLWQFTTAGSVYYEHNFLQKFADSGYKIKFFHGADLVFGMDTLLHSLRFDFENSDANDEIYKNEERYIFNGVTDEILYKNVLKHLEDDVASNDNYFYIVRTLTSHSPYTDPISKKDSLELTIRYADNALKGLVEQLENNGFFENGILVVIGDHRAMTPALSFEKKNLDTARIPLIIKTQKEPDHRVIPNTVSHQSLGTILQYLVLDQAFMLPNQVNPLYKTEMNETVLYRVFSPSNEVLVIKNNHDCKFIMKGDDSDFSKCQYEDILQESSQIKKFVYYLLSGNL